MAALPFAALRLGAKHEAMLRAPSKRDLPEASPARTREDAARVTKLHPLSELRRSNGRLDRQVLLSYGDDTKMSNDRH